MTTLKVSGLNQRDIICFWKYVDKGDSDDCWLWYGDLLPTGYGHFAVRHVGFAAHRLAWTLTNGAIPEGMYVCHKCDMPSCCNPSHMFLGTAQDNLDDMVAKGRSTHITGEDHPGHKLTWEQVREIRRRYAAKELSLSGLQQIYGVSVAALSHIVRNETWRE